MEERRAEKECQKLEYSLIYPKTEMYMPMARLPEDYSNYRESQFTDKSKIQSRHQSAGRNWNFNTTKVARPYHEFINMPGISAPEKIKNQAQPNKT